MALGAGFFAALLPDADVLIRSPSDPLLTLEFHRQFSHSLLFAPLGAVVAAGLVWLLLRKREPFFQLWLYALVAWLSACLLDAATSYGTQLLWPFSDARLAASIIAVVDPVFTLLLLAGVISALRWPQRWPTLIVLVLALTWLGTGWLQRERALATATGLAAARGHIPERIEAKPSIGNLLLWRTIYEADGRFHVDAVRAGLGRITVYRGGSVPRVRPGELPGVPAGSRLARDIARFDHVSSGWLAPWQLPDGGQLIGDIRYALRPDLLAPLWAITVDTAYPDRHVRLLTFRRVDEATRRGFVAMLRGQPLEASAEEF